MQRKEAADPVADSTAIALGDVLRYGAIGAGTGALLRGYMGAQSILDPKPKVDLLTEGPTVVSLAYPQQNRKRRPGDWIQTPGYKSAAEEPIDYQQRLKTLYERRGECPDCTKVLEDCQCKLKTAEPGMFDRAGQALYNVLPSGAQNFLNTVGPDVTSASSKIWHGPATVGAAAAGLAGGYGFVDWLQKQRRDNEMDRDLAGAERTYIDSLRGLRSAGNKIAEEEDPDSPAAALEELWENHKTAKAKVWDPIGDLAQPARNAAGWAGSKWLGLAAMAGIPTAMGAYNYVRNNTDNRAMQEALFLRQQAMQTRNPSPVVITIPDQDQPDPSLPATPKIAGRNSAVRGNYLDIEPGTPVTPALIAANMSANRTGVNLSPNQLVGAGLVGGGAALGALGGGTVGHGAGRGAARGAITGAGALIGGNLGQQLGNNPLTVAAGGLLGGGLGGLAGYLGSGMLPTGEKEPEAQLAA